MQKRVPEVKDNSKIKLERLQRTNRQLKQQIENHEENVKTIKNNNAKEVEKVHKELDQANNRNNELKNVLTRKETEILELQRKLYTMLSGVSFLQVMKSSNGSSRNMVFFSQLKSLKELRNSQ